ncbi:hypothetical protein SAMN05428975_2198 [Mucilaginibacter sp. OK268]|uniref:hypothetical protein n=1 Tax=Mucilaginibacter sp. OK268 TaxID=1881048 RepID=UPI0008869A31|nr:hypothetical protein [Mucilaginibacter sp. OK268]SDP69840.1 hypothetical protein SAMN05428975_2198 [Mucilaginibacter sp. OK268]
MEQRDMTIGVVTDHGFSVDKEYNDILTKHKANKNFFVIISDSNNLKIGKTHREVHKSKIISTSQIEDLRKRLLGLEMQDGGTIIQGRGKPSKNPIYLYIIDKG